MGSERGAYGEPVAAACSNENVPSGIFQTISEGAVAYSVKAPRPLTVSKQKRFLQVNERSPVPFRWNARISRRLTAVDGRADLISDLEIDFEVWSELLDLSCEVAPDVRA